MLPNFVYLGPDKAGSTWLYRFLTSHPDCFAPRAKELMFFNSYYDKGVDWYSGYYPDDGAGRTVRVDISHDYLFSRIAIARLVEVLPEARLMVCLREPAERAYSAYLYMQRQGRLRGSFAEALRNEPELVDHSNYSKHLRYLFEQVSRERVYLPLFDDLRRDPQSFADQLCDFLGIPALSLSADLAQPVLPAARARSPRVVAVLRLVAKAARGFGRPDLVTSVKSSSVVEKVLFSPFDSGRPTMTYDERAAARELFRASVLELDDLVGVDVSVAWGYR